MAKELIIVGANGLGLEAAWIAERMNSAEPTLRFQLLGLVDDSGVTSGATLGDIRVLGSVEKVVAAHRGRGCFFHCAIADNRRREQLAGLFLEAGFQPATLVDPSAIVASTAEVGEGSSVGAFSNVSPFARLGRHAMVGALASVGHHAVVGDFGQVGSGGRISGYGVVGKGGLVQPNAVVAPSVKLGDWTVLSPVSFAVRDVPARSTVRGNPARETNVGRTAHARKLTLLLSSAGRRVQLIECFRDSASNLGIDLRIIAVDSQPAMSAACQVADAAVAVPRCSDPGFIPALERICRDEWVDLLIPTIDPELLPLAEAKDVFARCGTALLLSDNATLSLARDKVATMAFLDRAEVARPRTASLADFRRQPDLIPGPVIAKPVGGSSSVGILHGRRPEDFASLGDSGYIVQERWVGREYTVNIFIDAAGKLRAAIPHRRIETRSGEVSKGRTERVPVLETAAERIAATLPGARGPLCFQAIVTESGSYVVFEINARFGGGYPLAHRAGGLFARWIFEEATGQPISNLNPWRPDLTMLRYDAAVFPNE